MASSEDIMRRVVTLIAIALSSAPVMAETEADLNKAIKEMESTELADATSSMAQPTPAPTRTS